MARNRAIVLECQPSSFERLVGECASELFMQEVDAALSEIDWTALDGINLDDWFRKTVSEHSTKPQRPRRSLQKRILLYAASFIAFLLATMTITFAVHEPARAAFLRFLVTRYPRYSEYLILEDPAVEPSAFVHIEPTYITEGFELYDEARFPDALSLYWLNDTAGSFIDYGQMDVDTQIYLDTEDADIRPIKIHGVEGELILKNNITTVQFFHGNSCFVVTTNFSTDECIKIAESLPLE